MFGVVLAWACLCGCVVWCDSLGLSGLSMQKLQVTDQVIKRHTVRTGIGMEFRRFTCRCVLQVGCSYQTSH